MQSTSQEASQLSWLPALKASKVRTRRGRASCATPRGGFPWHYAHATEASQQQPP